MTARSELKVRVALGFSKLIVPLFFTLTLHAQSTDDPLQTNVTIIGQNINFEDVLGQLTLQTKMQFIYSSSIVNLDKPVTLMARQQSLKDILDDLSAQMSITFKRQGDYFVVKKSNTPPKTNFTLAQPKLANSEDIEEPVFEMEKNTQEAASSGVNTRPQYSDRDSRITKDLLNFSRNIKWKYHPMLIADNGQDRPKLPWFASAGFLLNDYGIGVEMQGGVQFLYGVFNVSALGDGMYRFGYGVGTSIPLNSLVTANLAYTFASLSHTEIDTWRNQFQASSDHHQIKLQADLTLSRHFSVRFGPAFNVLRTSYHYLPEPAKTFTTVTYRPASTPPYLSPTHGYTFSSQYQVVATPDDYVASKIWVGFELGVAYHLNFFLHK